ncbi:MAG: hypothetical protein IJN72_00790 [Firmicutes bacterium]|nr:hypothetical protein [Bacillota bacterium]
MKRNVSVLTDLNGKKIVIINDIIFMGKQHIPWKDVEKYVRQYINDFFIVAEQGDCIHIGKDLPDEYVWSEYTKKLRGMLAKAKANAAQGIPEMIEISIGKRYKDNLGKKHKSEAEYGWYRYDTRFALPIYDKNSELVRYNVFQAELIVRHDADGKLYLYDIINIKKKKQSRPPE